MKRIYILLLIALPWYSVAQTPQKEHLKEILPGVADLLQMQIRLNPKDTAFQKTTFDNLPVKFTPFFVLDERAKIYTRADMDSIVTSIHYMFYEKE